MKLIGKYWLTLLGLLFGAFSGYLYYHYYGCVNGCTITGSPVNSTIYGAIMGALIFSMFKKEEKKK